MYDENGGYVSGASAETDGTYAVNVSPGKCKINVCSDGYSHPWYKAGGTVEAESSADPVAVGYTGLTLIHRNARVIRHFPADGTGQPGGNPGNTSAA